METAQIRIEGMTCEGCAKSVTRTLQAVAGVQDVHVSLADRQAKVTYDPARTRVEDLRRAVERAGYRAP
jgi:copper chaperone CopZ